MWAAGGGCILWSEWEALQCNTNSSCGYVPHGNVSLAVPWESSQLSPLHSHPEERMFATQSDVGLQWIFGYGTASAALEQSRLSGDSQ